MKGRVAEAAGRYVNGAQDCAGVRDFGKRRQGIRQVVKIVCKETEIRVKRRCLFISLKCRNAVRFWWCVASKTFSQVCNLTLRHSNAIVCLIVQYKYCESKGCQNNSCACCIFKYMVAVSIPGYKHCKQIRAFSIVL